MATTFKEVKMVNLPNGQMSLIVPNKGGQHSILQTGNKSYFCVYVRQEGKYSQKIIVRDLNTEDIEKIFLKGGECYVALDDDFGLYTSADKRGSGRIILYLEKPAELVADEDR